jgi:hypothetical protein
MEDLVGTTVHESASLEHYSPPWHDLVHVYRKGTNHDGNL